MSDQIVVLVEVPSATKGNVEAQRAKIEEEFKAFLNTALPAKDIHSTLGLPGDVQVEYRILAREQKAMPNAKLPLRFSIAGSDDIVKLLSAGFESQVGELLFNNLDRSRVPAMLKSRLGLPSDSEVSFELTIPETPPAELSSEALSVVAGCAPGSQYSWSKGCSSWPW